MELYSDRNPKTTIKGFGYKNPQKARNTLKKLKTLNKPEVYNFQVINTCTTELNTINIEQRIWKEL